MLEADTVAVVVTHRRPRLATELVRCLIGTEGFAPSRVILVVDGEGGLDDPRLEAAIQVHRRHSHSGPAAAFRDGLRAAFADPQVHYAYLCEDDVLLLGLPAPRVDNLRRLVRQHEASGEHTVGAVVAYGRRFGQRPGVTNPYLPTDAGPDLQSVDVAAWGATLVTRAVIEAGVLPDDHWFFAYEDFDFFLRMRRAGLDVLVDRASAQATAAATTTSAGRAEALNGHRPDDRDEAWRAYYVARNVFELTRRHGDSRWLLWHFLYSARRWQVATSGKERRAIARGLMHGLLGRSGRHPRYVRGIGEHRPPEVDGISTPLPTSNR